MGIGRREFLAMFGAMLAEVSLTRSQAVCLFDDAYVNRRLGIGFSKPTGWEFDSVKQMGTVKQGQLLDVGDPELSRSILDSIDLPFVAVSYASQSIKGQSKSAQFYLASHPAETEAESRLVSELLHAAFEKEPERSSNPQFSAPMQKVRQDWQACRELLAEFRVTSLPEETRLSNCEAAEYTASYLFEHEQLPAPRRVYVRTIAVEHRAFFYLIRLVNSEDQPFDFSDFVSTIRLI